MPVSVMFVRMPVGMVMLVIVGMVVCMLVRVVVGVLMGMVVDVRMFVPLGPCLMGAGRFVVFLGKKGQRFDESCIGVFDEPHALSHVLRCLCDTFLFENLSHLIISFEMIQVVIDPMS